MQSPAQLYSTFHKLSQSIISDRKEADKLLGLQFQQSEKPYENLARVLWESGAKTTDTYVHLALRLEQLDSRKRQAGKTLKENFVSYCKQFKRLAHQYFKRYSDDEMEEFFAKITLENAFELDLWKDNVNDHASDFNQFLSKVTNSLNKLYQESKDSYMEIVNPSVSDSAIRTTCWTVNSPSPDAILFAVNQVLFVMQNNEKSMKTHEQNLELANKIRTQEMAILNNLTKRAIQFQQDVQFVPLVETMQKQLELTRSRCKFDFPGFAALDKQQAIQLLIEIENKIPDPLDFKELEHRYSEWLEKNQAQMWRQIEIGYSEDMHTSLLHMETMRGKEITKFSQPVLDKLKNWSLSKAQSTRQKLSNVSSELKERLLDPMLSSLSDDLADHDALEWRRAMCKEIKTAIEGTRAGFVFGDPFREKAKEVYERYLLKPPECGNYKLEIHDRMKKINKKFEDETVKPLVSKHISVVSGHLDLFKQTLKQLQDHINQLETVGNVHELLDKTTLVSNVPEPYWCEQVVEQLELNSFATQKLFAEKEQNPNKKARNQLEEQKELVVVRAEIDLSLLNQLLGKVKSKKNVSWWSLFDFVQRYHLLLLRLNCCY